MRIKSILASGFVTLAALVSVGSNGCSDDEDAESRTSRKGEACQVTNDCSPGLSCLPIPGGAGGLCVTGEFRIAQTAKECAIIECSQATDCCGTPPAMCPQLLSQCADSGTGSIECEQYEAFCKCDTNKIDCEQNKCVTKCTGDDDCLASGSGRKCAGGKCVQCAGDTDCGDDLQCLSGQCQAPCESDGDCPGFNRCSSGRCIPGGCDTDRECVAATRNVEATCGTDGKCIVPCQTDLECGNPKSYSFFSCVQNQCVYVGCETDKDCRLLATGPSDAGTLPPKQRVVCRDKAAPGNQTIPAQ
jgi:hypothetical protein